MHNQNGFVTIAIMAFIAAFGIFWWACDFFHDGDRDSGAHVRTAITTPACPSPAPVSVPEPSTWLLIIIGLAMIALCYVSEGRRKGG